MKKKICFVVSAPVTVNAFMCNHILELSKIYDIYLVANFDGYKTDYLKHLPIKHIKDIGIYRGISLLMDLKAVYSLICYFNENNFDAVHTITPKAGLLGIVSSRLVGIKVRIHIFTGQVWHTKKGLFRKLLMFLDRLIVSNATFILVDGESQKQFLIDNAIIKSCNSKVLGKGSISGVDIAKLKPSIQLKEEVRQELGIKTDEVVFMFLGRMNKDKGVPELAIAFNNISQTNMKVRLLLVGDDEENMVIVVKNAVKDSDKVIFTGATRQPERLLQACDIFCLPSHREGFGTSVIEASSLEKSVICSDTYGLMETIIDKNTGIRHKVNNVESLQNAMETLLYDVNLRLVYGENGRNYILKHFTSQQITSRWIEFYKEILNM
jgi:glycosyltransferase involved in cell wall biosynthesis